MNAIAPDGKILADLKDMPVRFSHLRAYGQCAKKGYYARTNEIKPTQNMLRGRMVHGLLADQGRYAAYPGPVRRGKEYDKFVVDHPGCEILLKSDYDLANAMADAVRADKEAMEYLAGVKEETIYFEYNGLKCRATPDVRNPAERWLTEIKATADASEWFWRFHFRKMKYHVQMWMQGVAAANKDGRMPEKFRIVAVEDKPPHVVTKFELQPRALEEGCKLLATWSEALKVAEDSNIYTGYSTAVVPLDIPAEETELIWPDDEGEGEDEESENPRRDVTMAG